LPLRIKDERKGIIETKDGQTIGWISSDIGTTNSTRFYFHGIILFNDTKSEKLSDLNNTLGVDFETPKIKRTIWRRAKKAAACLPYLLNTQQIAKM